MGMDTFDMRFIEVALDSVASERGTLDWEALAGNDDHPWLGIASPQLTVMNRRWIWEVVTCEQHARGGWGIVTLQDIVVVELKELAKPRRRLSAIYHTNDVGTLEVPARLLPPWPWELCWYSGWSAGTLAAALNRWSELRYDYPMFRADARDDGDKLQVGERTLAEPGAMDVLLSVDPETAAGITALFNYLAEHLQGDFTIST